MKISQLASFGASLLGGGTKTGIAEGLGVLALAADAATGRPQGSG